MRTRIRISGLLVALTLLLTAIPTFDCCFGAGAGGGLGGPGGLGNRNSVAHAAAPSHVPPPPADAFPESVVHDASAHGCTGHAAPTTQAPYIETGGGSGGAPASTRSSTDAAGHLASSTLANTPRSARPHGIAADATGPPLWLTACVSRT